VQQETVPGAKRDKNSSKELTETRPINGLYSWTGTSSSERKTITRTTYTVTATKGEITKEEGDGERTAAPPGDDPGNSKRTLLHSQEADQEGKRWSKKVILSQENQANSPENKKARTQVQGKKEEFRRGKG